MGVLVLDEQVGSSRLAGALSDRGIASRSVGDLGLQGQPDPDVVRRIAERMTAPWVLVTMDLSIVSDHTGFDWDRYGIGWVRIRGELRGTAAEQAKVETVHTHARRMEAQRPGDHFTYWPAGHSKYPPSIATMTEKRLRGTG